MLGALAWLPRALQQRAPARLIVFVDLGVGDQRHGKKWSSKHCGQTQQAQQRQEKYEKRFRRRTSNRELKRLFCNTSEPLDAAKYVEEALRGRFGVMLGSKKSLKKKKRNKRPESYTAADEDGPPEDSQSWATSSFLYRGKATRNFERQQHHVQKVWARIFQHFRSPDPDYSIYGRQNSNFWSYPGAEEPSKNHDDSSDFDSHRPGPLRPQVIAMQRHLETIGLPSSASIDSQGLRQAFLKAAMDWHPDRHASCERARSAAEERFKEIQTSYRFLQTQLCSSR